MTRQEAANLLRRKKLKGEEVGRALLLSLVSDYQRREFERQEPLFTQDDLTKMVAALPSEYERGIYAEYAELHEGLVEAFREAQGMLQQLQHGLLRLMYRLNLAEKVRKLEAAVLPLAEHTLDPEVAALPGTVRDIFPDGFRDILENPLLQQELRASRSRLVLPAYTRVVGYNGMVGVFAEGLSLPELSALAIPLEMTLVQAESYDALLASCMEALPREEADRLGEICPPLALAEIQTDPVTTGLLVRSLSRGPGAAMPPDAILRAVMFRGEEKH